MELTVYVTAHSNRAFLPPDNQQGASNEGRLLLAKLHKKISHTTG